MLKQNFPPLLTAVQLHKRVAIAITGHVQMSTDTWYAALPAHLLHCTRRHFLLYFAAWGGGGEGGV